MTTTLQAVKRTISAMAAYSYEIGILQNDRMTIRTVSSSAVLNLLAFLQRENAHGAHIYIRPHGEHSLTLLDDLSIAKAHSLSSAGFQPALLVETSPGNFQAWLKHSETLPRQLSTFAAKILASRFGADPSSADWRHFGRLPGFTNRKRRYQNAETGLYPFVHLRQASGIVYSAAEHFLFELASHHQLVEQQREQAKVRRVYSNTAPRTCSLSHFRTLPKYVNQPAQADMAFAVYQMSIGVPDQAIAADLVSNYLSRDSNKHRRAAYVERTLAKARSYVR